MEQTGERMIAISVMVEVFPEFARQYQEAALRHAHNSLSNETGCLAFNVYAHPENPNRFFLHEEYASEKDLNEVHKVAPYLQEFRKTTASWVKGKDSTVWRKLSSS